MQTEACGYPRVIYLFLTSDFPTPNFELLTPNFSHLSHVRP